MAAAQIPQFMQIGQGALALLGGAVALFESLVDHLGQQPKHVAQLTDLKAQYAALGGPSDAQAATPASEPAPPAPSVADAVAALRNPTD